MYNMGMTPFSSDALHQTGVDTVNTITNYIENVGGEEKMNDNDGGGGGKGAGSLTSAGKPWYESLLDFLKAPVAYDYAEPPAEFRHPTETKNGVTKIDNVLSPLEQSVTDTVGSLLHYGIIIGAFILLFKMVV